MAGTDKLGTSAFGMVKAAEALGFSARGVKGDIRTLLAARDLPLPIIAHTITSQGMLHYVVIHRIRNGILTIADPAKGMLKLSAEEFAEQWTGVLIMLAPSTDGLLQGPKTESTLRRFLGLLQGQGSFLALLTLASALITAIGIGAAFYFKVIIDQVIPGALWRTLTTISLAILGLYIISGLLNAARYQLVLHLQQRIDIPLILGYYNHVMGLPMSFYGTRKVGEVITRFSDAGKIQQALTGASVTVFVDVIMSVAGCFILAKQDVVLFGITVVIAICHIILGLVVLRPVARLNEESMEANAQVTSHFVESITGAQTVKAFNAQHQVENKADTLYVSFLRTIFRFGQWQNAQTVLTNTVRAVGTALVLWVGAVRILQGDLTVGGLVVFTTLMNYFLDPVQSLIGLQPELQAAAVAARRLSDVLVLEAEKVDGEGQIELAKMDQPIVFKHVDFRYGTRQLVLKDVSFIIPPGAAVGLVGESGSGKTTIAKLLMKFYQPEKGEISVGDLSLADVAATSLRERIAYVSQETSFFTGTIEENLKLAAPAATMEEIVYACKVARAHDFISEMPARYQSYLEEDAENLSGGQRQRLAIARALLRGADMLILDEATSNMDSISEKAVSETISNIGSGMTRLVIAHRLSTIVSCDLIYVMQGGQIVEAGTHSRLLAAGGVYAQLWLAQTGERVVARAQPVSFAGTDSVTTARVISTVTPDGVEGAPGAQIDDTDSMDDPLRSAAPPASLLARWERLGVR